MSYLTVAGVDGLRARIGIPRVGVWHADVALDTDDPSAIQDDQAVELILDNGRLTLQGAVRRASVAYGTTLARLVGGAGGLPQPVPAKAFAQVSLQAVLQDTLQAIGEQLSGSADPNTLALFLSSWTREGTAAYRAVAALAAEAGVPWRLLQDGSLWLGPETWPSSSVKHYEVLSWDPADSRAEMSSDDPGLWPGTTWEGGQVSYVEHRIDPDKLRTKVWFEDLSLPPA
ncbi:MAG TPA: hypothetical protein VMB50_20850 [Myxococcales bacterium]|nr:hypothetical protein [Myxococcales bacterium]